MMRERGVELGAKFDRTASGLLVPPGTVPPQRPVAVDLFSGAGGFSLGFHNAGWNVAAACDGWAVAAQTYLVNLGSPLTRVHMVGDELSEGRKLEHAVHAEYKGRWITAAEFLEAVGCKDAAGSGWIASRRDSEPACEHFYLGDVRGLTGQKILDDLGRDVVAVFGGPPCQGFSAAGRRNVMDPRNSLVFEFMRIVCEVRPQTFVMENVPGMVSMVTPEGVSVIDAVARIAADGGFGTYDAIRRSLLSHPDARAAMLTQKVGGRTDRSNAGVKPSDRNPMGSAEDELQLPLELPE